MASGAGQTAVITLLLDHGADVHAVDKVRGGVCVCIAFCECLQTHKASNTKCTDVVNFMERAPIEWPVCGKFLLMRTVHVVVPKEDGIPSDFIFRILPFL